MWSCTHIQNDKGYKGFLNVYNEILNFILYDKTNDYGVLLEKTRKEYIECLNNKYSQKLVEPRELYMLLNYIDNSQRFYYAPRPYIRLGNISFDYIYIVPETNRDNNNVKRRKIIPDIFAQDLKNIPSASNSNTTAISSSSSSSNSSSSSSGSNNGVYSFTGNIGTPFDINDNFQTHQELFNRYSFENNNRIITIGNNTLTSTTNTTTATSMVSDNNISSSSTLSSHSPLSFWSSFHHTYSISSQQQSLENPSSSTTFNSNNLQTLSTVEELSVTTRTTTTPTSSQLSSLVSASTSRKSAINKRKSSNNSIKLACIFCGVICEMPDYLKRKKNIISLDVNDDADLNESIKWRLIVGENKLNSSSFKNSSDEMLADLNSKKGYSYVHDSSCPILWLSSSNNIIWYTKMSMLYVNEITRFKSVLRLLEYGVKTEEEWLEFVLITSMFENRQGCCERTMRKLYDSVVEYKLASTKIKNFKFNNEYTIMTDEINTTSTKHTAPRSTYQNGTSLGMIDSNFTRDERRFVIDPLGKSSNDYKDCFYDIVLPVPMTVAKECEIRDYYDKYIKDTDYKRNCMIYNIKKNTIESIINSRQNSLTVPEDNDMVNALAKIKCLQGFVVKRNEGLVCVFCGSTFDNKVFTWNTCKNYYTPDEVYKIVRYLLYDGNRDVDVFTNSGKSSGVGSSRSSAAPTSKKTSKNNDNSVKYLNSKYYPTNINDLLEGNTVFSITNTFKVNKLENYQPILINEKYKNNNIIINLETDYKQKLCIWICSSMNLCHTKSCLYYKNSYRFLLTTYECSTCKISISGIIYTFSCGHSICKKCNDNPRLTYCSICFSGVRVDYMNSIV